MDLPVTIITVVCNLILGLLAYFKKPTSATNRLLFLLSFILASWTIANYFSLHSADLQTTLLWIKIVLAIVTPMWTVLFLLALVFPSDRLVINRIQLSALLIYTIFTSIVAVSPYMFTGITASGSNISPTPGYGIIFHALLAVGSVVMSSIILIRKFLHSDYREKTQLKFFLFGVIATFTLLITTNFILVNVFKTSFFVVFGPFFTLILVGSITYAIVRHRFLDIRLVVARAVAYSVLITLIGVFYVGATFVLSSVFLRSAIPGNQSIIYIILTIIVALSFERVRYIVEKLTDGIFFKGRYDTNQLLFRLGSVMSTNIELRLLASQIVQTLIEQMRISRGAFVILGEGLTSIYDIIDIGFSQKLSVLYDQVSPFFPLSEIIVFDELEDNHLKSLMREMDVAVMKTLKVGEQVVGLLFLGEKASGEIYSEQDLKILEILAPEMAVAIQNSQSYDKIKKFNVILSQEIKKATTDLQQANEKLKQMDHLKDDFVSIASHELRTPMTAIRSYAWMALHKSDVPLSEKLQKYLIRVLISTERLINLVNDMLNLSRIESGRIEIKPEAVDLLSLVKDIIDELYFSKSQEKHIEFVVLEKTVPKIFADPEKLRQVFLNIVGNSLKFTPHGGKIIFDFFTDGQVVETSIKDTGVGISQEDLSKLFHKFSRLDNSYTAAATSGGTGLGLYISKNLIELMKGKIRAQSEGVGKGTTFTVSLPVATKEKIEHASEYAVEPEGEAKPLEPVTIGV